MGGMVAAQGQPPLFRARADLVQIDVVVVDADGRAVRGLTAADFHITGNGASQRIAAFQEISHEPASASTFPPEIRVDVGDNATNPDRLIVLVLDDLHFQSKTPDVKDMARRVVAGIGPRAALALVTTSGSFGIEPTENRAALLAEIDRFLDRYDPELRRLVPGAQMPVPTPIVNAIGEPVTARGPYRVGLFFGDLGTYKTVKDVIKKIALDGFGRRNALVWISGGMTSPTLAQCERTDGNPHYCGEFAGLVEALRASNVAAYGVSTGDVRSRLLQDVAELSGGFVITPGRFDRDLPRLIEDLDHYYLVGIQPAEANAERYHQLRVAVSRPDVIVRHRSSYHTGVDAPKPKNKSPLARLSEGVLPVSDLPLRVLATPLTDMKGRPRTLITLEAAAPRAALVEPDRFLRDVIRYQVWAVDLRKKKVGRSVARQARLVLSPEEAGAVDGDPLPFQLRTVLELPPGRYQLRASAASTKAGKSGSVYLDYEVEEVRKQQLSVGPPMLTYDGRQRVSIVRGGLAEDISTIAPTLDRRFARTDVLRILCDVMPGPIDATDITLDLHNVRTAAQRPLTVQRVEAAKSARIDQKVSLADVEPGAYILRLRATQGRMSITRDVAFVVY
jgi:VWFA-related protein